MKKVTVSALALGVLLTVTVVIAQDRKSAIESEPRAKTTVSDSVKNMTKGELVREITSELNDEEELLDYIPTLKKMKDERGVEYYTYSLDGKTVKISDLDRTTLEKLLSRIYNQATLIQTDRINKQLESMRSIQNINRQISVPRVPPPVPTAPRQPPKPPPSPQPATRR
jgi:hypothetical protein